MFLGVLAILALIINWYFWTHRSVRYSQDAGYTSYSQPSRTPNNTGAQNRSSEAVTPSRVADNSAAREAIQAVETLKQNLSRYVNSGSSRAAGTKRVALVVATENGKPERGISAALASRFKTIGVELEGSFFTPAFFADGLFGQCFTDITKPIAKLELNKSLDGLLLGRATTEYTSNPSLENVLTANLTVQIMAVPTASSMAGESWTFTAAGAGFHKEAARAMAQERLLEQIKADTRMSLNAVLDPN